MLLYIYEKKSRLYPSTYTCTYLCHIQTYMCIYTHTHIYVNVHKDILKVITALKKREGKILLGYFNILSFIDTMKEREFVNVSYFVGFIRRVACRDPSNIHPSNSSPAGGYNRDQGKALQMSTLSLIWSLHSLQVVFHSVL